MTTIYQPPAPPPDAVDASQHLPRGSPARPAFGSSAAGAATLLHNRKARIGVVLLGLFVLVALLAPVIAPYSPTESDFLASQGPSHAAPARHDRLRAGRALAADLRRAGDAARRIRRRDRRDLDRDRRRHARRLSHRSSSTSSSAS